jgi:hypothetical protein
MDHKGHGAAIELITPKVAKEMLATMRSNRPISDAKVLEYALKIEAGEWVLNGETIKFDADGKLFDGQHRLHAGVLADKPFRSLVVRGIADPNAFATVDVGKNRSHSDVFGIAGFSNPSLIASITMILYLHEKKKLSWNGPAGLGRYDRPANSKITAKIKRMPQRAGEVPKEELLAFAEPLEEGLASAARYAERWKAARLMTRPLVGAGYYLFRDKSFNDAEQFFADLQDGTGLQRQDAVYHLRERLIANSSADAKLSRWYVLGLMFKCWNKRRASEPVRYLKVQDGEEFPKKLL